MKINGTHLALGGLLLWILMQRQQNTKPTPPVKPVPTTPKTTYMPKTEQTAAMGYHAVV